MKKAGGPAKPAKLTSDEVIRRVREAAATGSYAFKPHAHERLQERFITVSEVVQVFERGFHEAKKDEFKPEHDGWNYAIRGKTVDGRSLRIPVAIKGKVIVITAIDLDKGALH